MCAPPTCTPLRCAIHARRASTYSFGSPRAFRDAVFGDLAGNSFQSSLTTTLGGGELLVEQVGVGVGCLGRRGGLGFGGRQAPSYLALALHCSGAAYFQSVSHKPNRVSLALWKVVRACFTAPPLLFLRRLARASARFSFAVRRRSHLT